MAPENSGSRSSGSISFNLDTNEATITANNQTYTYSQSGPPEGTGRVHRLSFSGAAGSGSQQSNGGAGSKRSSGDDTDEKREEKRRRKEEEKE